MKKTKVLLIQGVIPHYRVEIFNRLAQKVDLTVMYSEGDVPASADFNTIKIPCKKIRYRIHLKNVYSIAQKYDAVICMYDMSYVYARLLYLLPHKYKLIYWGIGVSAGYTVRFDSIDIFARLKRSMKKADALVFYSDYPKRKYAKLGIPDEKIFVANNTVKVLDIEEKEKNEILFIGTLYKQKKIFKLLENYKKAYDKNNNVHNLTVIGDGDEYENIVQWIKDNRLEGKIKLTGGIYDDEILKEYFSRAVMCISPDQAGLSVLKSMGYGVPYVTHKNAITGGEIFNIKHGVNGILIDDFNEIAEIIIESSVDTQKYLEMGREAKKYYNNYRTPDIMVKGFVDAIEFALK